MTDAEPFEAFLETHCVSCHGPKKEKGDLRIDRLSRDFKLGADAHHWAEMIEQVNSGEMPPKKEKQPTQAVETRKAAQREALRTRRGLCRP